MQHETIKVWNVSVGFVQQFCFLLSYCPCSDGCVLHFVHKLCNCLMNINDEQVVATYTVHSNHVHITCTYTHAVMHLYIKHKHTYVYTCIHMYIHTVDRLSLLTMYIHVVLYALTLTVCSCFDNTCTPGSICICQCNVHLPYMQLVFLFWSWVCPSSAFCYVH